MEKAKNVGLYSAVSPVYLSSVPSSEKLESDPSKIY